MMSEDAADLLPDHEPDEIAEAITMASECLVQVTEACNAHAEWEKQGGKGQPSPHTDTIHRTQKKLWVSLIYVARYPEGIQVFHDHYIEPMLGSPTDSQEAKIVVSNLLSNFCETLNAVTEDLQNESESAD